MSPTIQELINELIKLPGVGPKTAERFAYFLLKQSTAETGQLIKKLQAVKDQIKRCSLCYNWDNSDPCQICRDQKRDDSLLCVVALSQDIAVMEKTSEFSGRYHVLEGVIRPTDGITPDKLMIVPLLEKTRAGNGKIKEVLLALNPDIEGEATINYLAGKLKPLGVKVTRLAQGLPNGSDLEYADEITLKNAIQGKQQI